MPLRMIRSRFAICLAALWASLAAAQQSGWVTGEVNTTMCYWTSPRAAVVRDTLYIDGGYLWWEPGMADGSYGALIADGNPQGLVYLLNFSTPYDTSQNLTSVFNTTSKASGGGSANNIGPNYYDGTMLANDYEWFTYGGLLGVTDAYKPPAADSVAAYEVYASGPPKQFEPGYILDELPTGITRYLTYGAGVSVPSENLGFYFGGLRSASGGPIYYGVGPANESVNAEVESPTLIELNMSVQQQETWNNYTLPATVSGRASAEIAWVPYSTQGLLVAIGGVINPSYANVNTTNTASENTASEQVSPAFMTTVSVYDVANNFWYEQPTSGDAPGQLAQGCTVVASAQDGSSHNIYWYGGFDGLHLAGNFSDDVWVLSIPTFTWAKVYSGTTTHARAGHRCAKPYPDQMLVIGGYSSLSGTEPTCVDGGIIQIFNLSSATWINSYNPKVWSNYTVPQAIVGNIGGSSTGGATKSSPASGFANSNLTTLFQQSYNSTKITNWYPYQVASATSTPRATLTAVVKSGTPSFLGPVLGVILGLFFITLLVLAFLLYRRRKYLKIYGNTNPSEAGTLDTRHRVSNWLRATPADAKAPTVTTDETPASPYEDEPAYMHEAAGEQVHEMMDTSRPFELHDTGLMPLETRKGFSTRRGLASSPSVTSQASTVSRISNTSLSRPPISPILAAGGVSPSGADNNMRITSGVSNLSETERGHLRGISETSVSTDGNYELPVDARISAEQAEPLRTPRLVSPLSPPEGEHEGGDYLSSGVGSPSQSRRSNFAEGLDEVRR